VNHEFDLACTITGAGGFVGSCLVRALMEQEDYKVRIFAVDKTPGKLLDIAGLPGSFIGGPAPGDFSWSMMKNKVTFHEWDVTMPLRSTFLGVDAIYHFAGIANPKVYLEDPIGIMDLNLLGLRNILDKIVLWSGHRPRIIFSSTSEVYGLNDHVPFSEDALKSFSDQRRWCYALSKLTAEHYLRAFADQGIRHTIFRFFNFVGKDIDAPGMGRVLTKMVSSAYDEGVIRVTEPGTQTRCFTHEDDFTVALVRALTMKRDARFGAAFPASPDAWTQDYTMNLGNDEEISMWDLAIKIRDILIDNGLPDGRGWQGGINVEVVPREEMYGQGYDDALRRQPNIDRARDILNWEPKRRLDDFLPELVDAIVARHLRATVGAR
jgi:nucleoside-diphosphate-sugar epimerase